MPRFAAHPSGIPSQSLLLTLFILLAALNQLVKQACRSRGRCCGSGCRRCPFAHERVPAARRAAKIAQPSWLLAPQLGANFLRDFRAADSKPAAEHIGGHSPSPGLTNLAGAVAAGCSHDGISQAIDETGKQLPVGVLFWSTGKDSFLTLQALRSGWPLQLAAESAEPAAAQGAAHADSAEPAGAGASSCAAGSAARAAASPGVTAADVPASAAPREAADVEALALAQRLVLLTTFDAESREIAHQETHVSDAVAQVHAAR